jgi:hypothetical protein
LIVGENGAVSIGGALTSFALKVYGNAQVTSFFYTNVTEVSNAIIFDGGGSNGIKKNTGLDFFTYGTSSTIRFTNNNYGISSGETTMLVDTTKKYVGIGTDGPSASLHIKGTSSVSGNSLLVENSSNTQLLKVLNNGQIILGDSNSAAAPASSVQGVFIIGQGNANYGPNSSNPNLLTFIVGSTDASFISGIQGASVNYGNVRSGIYFTNNASDIVFRAGYFDEYGTQTAQLQQRMRIGVSGNVNINSTTAMSGSKLFIQSSTSSTTIGSNVMLDLYNGDNGIFDSISEIAFSQNGQPGASQPYNVGHRYALITGYAITGNNSVSTGGIKFSTRALTGASLVTSLVVDQNGSVYNEARGSNTLYGLNALLVSTGINNVAIGAQSLRNNTIGANNTAIGYNAGYLVSGTTSGATNSSNSVFLGYDTRPQADGQSNQIVIGYGATGNGSNSVTLGNNDITRTYLKGKVVITDGTQGNGYILTSDVNGVASWTASVKPLPVVETAINYTVTNANNGGIIIFTTSATCSIPTGLEDAFECTFVTLTGVTLTVSPAVGVSLFNNTGLVLPEELSFTLKRRLAADQFITSGNL